MTRQRPRPGTPVRPRVSVARGVARPAARARGLLASLSLASLASLALPVEAAAWEPSIVNASMACIQQGIPYARFSSGTIDVVLHAGACPEDADPLNLFCMAEGNGLATAQLVEIMERVHAQVEDIPGVNLSFNLTIASDTMVYGELRGMQTPTLHVGVVNEHDRGAGTVGYTSRDLAPACVYHEAWIMLASETFIEGLTWAARPTRDERVGVELGSSVYYRDAGLKGEEISRDVVYAEPVYLHELLHALGLGHANDDYAMTNYGELPWTLNHLGEVAARPLPDDAQGLRALYPSGDSDAVDFFLTNSWTLPDEQISVETGEACSFPLPDLAISADGQSSLEFQRMTCEPAFGSRKHDGLEAGFILADDFDTCGTYDPALEGSEYQTMDDEWIYASVTLNNLGMHALELELRAHLSADDYLDAGDIVSPTVRTVEIPAGSSKNVVRRFRTPDSFAVSGTGSNRRYRHVLIEATSGSGDRDVIPMRAPLIVNEDTSPSGMSPSLIDGVSL